MSALNERVRHQLNAVVGDALEMNLPELIVLQVTYSLNKIIEAWLVHSFLTNAVVIGSSSISAN